MQLHIGYIRPSIWMGTLNDFAVGVVVVVFQFAANNVPCHCVRIRAIPGVLNRFKFCTNMVVKLCSRMDSGNSRIGLQVALKRRDMCTCGERGRQATTREYTFSPFGQHHIPQWTDDASRVQINMELIDHFYLDHH